MSDDAYVKDKTKEDILSDLLGTAMPGSQVHEQQKAAIIVRCVQDIEKSFKSLQNSIDNASESSNKLSGKVFLLDIILVISTVVMAVAAALPYFYPK